MSECAGEQHKSVDIFLSDVCACGHERYRHADRAYDNGDISQVQWVACRAFPDARHLDCTCTGFVMAPVQPARPMALRDRLLERIAVALEKIAAAVAPLKIGDGKVTSSLHETLLTQTAVIEEHLNAIRDNTGEVTGCIEDGRYLSTKDRS